MLKTQKTWTTVFCAAAMLHVHPAIAQAPLAPLSASDVVQSETSRTPVTSWLGKVTGWERFEPRRLTVVRGDGSVQSLVGGVREPVSQLRLDAVSFTTMGYTQAQAPEVLGIETTRPRGDLVPGMKWASKITYVGMPADWCPSELKTVHDSSFEVQAQEMFAMRIDGQDIALPVLPVVERGIWKRCYTGKRYQRFLWSPDLLSVVAVEFQTYNPLGKLHEGSFLMRMKGIERGKQ